MGAIVEQQVRRSMISISDLSKNLNISRRTLYNWFNQRSIPPAVVVHIGEHIGYDFREKLPDLPEDVPHPPAREYGNQADSDIHYKTKYLILLEKYNELLEQKIKTGCR